MKKNSLKVLSLSLLLSTLCVAGCSCNNDKPNVAEIQDGDLLSGLTDDASDYSLLDIYNAVIANGNANTSAADKLIDIVATTILDVDNPESDWADKYTALIDEGMKALKESDEYKVNGKFNEDLLVLDLLAKGYDVSKTDYKDYINRELRVDALSSLLKQKYIKEETLKNSKNIVTNKKIRDVEYITVSSALETDYPDYEVEENGEKTKVDINVRNFMRDIRDQIVKAIADETVADIDFEDYADQIKEHLKGAVKGEFDKIKYAADYSQELAAKYTANYTRTAEEGFAERNKTVDNLEINFSKVLSSDSESSSIVSAAITSKLLSLSNPSSDNKRAVQIGDWYYLVSANAGTTVDANDILLTETTDSSAYTYSIVRFKVINADNYSANEDKVIELLANSSTLASNAVSHYLGQYKNTIKIHDDAVYDYLKELYPDVFTD